MTKQHDERLTEVGTSAMDSIRCMVAALNCDYDRLEELRDERDDHDTSELWAYQNPDDAKELAELEADAAANGDTCESREDAEERIQEDALSLEFRSGWVTDKTAMEAEEYCLLLTTGGPAVRIIGEIEQGEATSARLEVQDWGTPWTEHFTTGDDHEALMDYVRCFYFGE